MLSVESVSSSSLGDLHTNEDYANYFYRNQYQNYAVLKLCVSPPNPELTELYRSAIEKHNTHLNNDMFSNAGFDLFMPTKVQFAPTFESQMVSLGVKTEMIHCEVDRSKSSDIEGISYASGYYLYPRSSISKTPLMLANQVGIIDSGYRGEVIAAIRNFYPDVYTVEKHTRLFQICHPQLAPVYVVLVDENNLTITSRGVGGFGSTGGTNA